jgi:hypothetical protein
LERKKMESISFRIPRAVQSPNIVAEGVGFEPTVGLTPRSISSRVP